MNPNDFFDAQAARRALVVDSADNARGPGFVLRPQSACYRCGGRLYFIARMRGLGLCHCCEHGIVKTTKGVGATLRTIEWSPYGMDEFDAATRIWLKLGVITLEEARAKKVVD